MGTKKKIGLPGGPNELIIGDQTGQWNPVNKGIATRIFGKKINMSNVPPLIAVDNNGNKQKLNTGQQAVFPGAEYVDEFPIASAGRELPKAQNSINFDYAQHAKNIINSNQGVLAANAKEEEAADIGNIERYIQDLRNRTDSTNNSIIQKQAKKDSILEAKQDSSANALWNKIRLENNLQGDDWYRKHGGSVSAKQVHAAADRVGMKWDNDEAFMALSMSVTKKKHIDDMTSKERALLINAINKQGSSELTMAQTGQEMKTDLNQVFTYANNKDWFDNNFVSDDAKPSHKKWLAGVWEQVKKGTHGFNPATGTTHVLHKMSDQEKLGLKQSPVIEGDWNKTNYPHGIGVTPEGSASIEQQQTEYLNSQGLPTEIGQPCVGPNCAKSAYDEETTSFIGSTPDQILTYKNHPQWFDSRAKWLPFGVTDRDGKYENSIKKKIHAGTHGFNPATGALWRLGSEDQQAYGQRDDEKAEYLKHDGTGALYNQSGRNSEEGGLEEALYQNPTNSNRADLLDYGPGAQKVFAEWEKQGADSQQLSNLVSQMYPDMGLTGEEIDRYNYKMSSIRAGQDITKANQNANRRFGEGSSFPTYLVDAQDQVNMLDQVDENSSIRDYFNAANSATYGDPDAYAAMKAGDHRYFTNRDGSRNEERFQKYMTAGHMMAMYHNPVWNVATAFHPASWPLYAAKGVAQLPGDIQDYADGTGSGWNIAHDVLMTAPLTIPSVIKGVQGYKQIMKPGAQTHIPGLGGKNYAVGANLGKGRQVVGGNPTLNAGEEFTNVFSAKLGNKSIQIAKKVPSSTKLGPGSTTPTASTVDGALNLNQLNTQLANMSGVESMAANNAKFLAGTQTPLQLSAGPGIVSAAENLAIGAGDSPLKLVHTSPNLKETGLPNLTEQGDQLPPGWTEWKDPNSGVPYYHNKETDVSQWEHPNFPKQNKKLSFGKGATMTIPNPANVPSKNFSYADVQNKIRQPSIEDPAPGEVANPFYTKNEIKDEFTDADQQAVDLAEPVSADVSNVDNSTMGSLQQQMDEMKILEAEMMSNQTDKKVFMDYIDNKYGEGVAAEDYQKFLQEVQKSKALTDAEKAAMIPAEYTNPNTAMSLDDQADALLSASGSDHLTKTGMSQEEADAEVAKILAGSNPAEAQKFANDSGLNPDELEELGIVYGDGAGEISSTAELNFAEQLGRPIEKTNQQIEMEASLDVDNTLLDDEIDAFMSQGADPAIANDAMGTTNYQHTIQQIPKEDLAKPVEWVMPNQQYFDKEWAIEHELPGREKFFDNKAHFDHAVETGEVKTITPDMKIQNTSHWNSKEDIIAQQSGYNSWPEFRNEGTIDAIINGFNNGSMMNLPIVIQKADGTYRMFAGDTRTGIAKMLGVQPKALFIKNYAEGEEVLQGLKHGFSPEQTKLYQQIINLKEGEADFMAQEIAYESEGIIDPWHTRAIDSYRSESSMFKKPGIKRAIQKKAAEEPFTDFETYVRHTLPQIIENPNNFSTHHVRFPDDVANKLKALEGNYSVADNKRMLEYYDPTAASGGFSLGTNVPIGNWTSLTDDQKVDKILQIWKLQKEHGIEDKGSSSKIMQNKQHPLVHSLWKNYSATSNYERQLYEAWDDPNMSSWKLKHGEKPTQYEWKEGKYKAVGEYDPGHVAVRVQDAPHRSIGINRKQAEDAGINWETEVYGKTEIGTAHERGKLDIWKGHGESPNAPTSKKFQIIEGGKGHVFNDAAYKRWKNSGGYEKLKKKKYEEGKNPIYDSFLTAYRWEQFENTNTFQEPMSFSYLTPSSAIGSSGHNKDLIIFVIPPKLTFKHSDKIAKGIFGEREKILQDMDGSTKHNKVKSQFKTPGGGHVYWGWFIDPKMIALPAGYYTVEFVNDQEKRSEGNKEMKFGGEIEQVVEEVTGELPKAQGGKETKSPNDEYGKMDNQYMTKVSGGRYKEAVEQEDLGVIERMKRGAQALYAMRSKEDLNRYLYKTVTPIGYDVGHATNEFFTGERLPFEWDGEKTSFDEFEKHSRFKDNPKIGKYIKDASMDAWGLYLGLGQENDTFVKSKSSDEKQDFYTFNDDMEGIKEDIFASGLLSDTKKSGAQHQVEDSGAGGFTMKNYMLTKKYDRNKKLWYIQFDDEYDLDITKFDIPAEVIAGEPFKIRDKLYYKGTGDDIDFLQSDDLLLQHDINLDDLKKGIKWAESKNGLLMKNPESSASGYYGQRFSEIKNDYKEGREAFIKDVGAQDKYFDKRFLGDVKDVPGIQKSAVELYEKYKPQMEEHGYSPTDLAAVINFLGREGARRWAGYVLRDGSSLGVVFPHLYSANTKQSNKTPNDYIEMFREGVNRKKYGGEKIKRAKGLLKEYRAGGSISAGDGEYLQKLGIMPKAQAGEETVSDSTDVDRANAAFLKSMGMDSLFEIYVEPEEVVEEKVVEKPVVVKKEVVKAKPVIAKKPVVTPPKEKVKVEKKEDVVVEEDPYNILGEHTFPPIEEDTIPVDTIPEAIEMEADATANVIEPNTNVVPEDFVEDDSWYSGITDYFAGNQGWVPGDQSGLRDYLEGNQGILPGDQTDWNYLHGNEGIIPGDQTQFKEDAIDYIGENISQDVANVLPMSMEDKIAIGTEYLHKKTKTGPYSEEAIEAQNLELYHAEERKLEADAAEADRLAEAERLRLEKLIFAKEQNLSDSRYTYGSGHQRRSAVIDLGTSGGRPGVKFGLGHNIHSNRRAPGLYDDQPNTTIENSQGILGAFHNKFVPYDQTSNNKFKVPVQIAWNQETGIFTAKKTEDLLDTDLVVPYGKSGDIGNVTRLEDLDIKKLPDGSFDITTGMDKVNGTSIIKSKSGLPFHIGVGYGGKERVLNSKDLNEYRPLRGGLVVIFDDASEVSVAVTGSPNEIFTVIDELQKKHPKKKWNMVKGDTGSYGTSAFNPDGVDTTDAAAFKSYSNQNTYGESQYLVLLKQAQEEAEAAEKTEMKTGGEQINQKSKLSPEKMKGALTTYANYVNGKFYGTIDEQKAQKLYDKLNRLYYKEAKQKGVDVRQYVMGLATKGKPLGAITS